MTPNGIITLMTDFGGRDAYAGAMKGVILGIHHGSVIVDITHEIPAHDIREAAFSLSGYVRFFPEGSIHMVIVDPGVGGERKPLIVKTERCFLVGPDNGVFTHIYNREKVVQAVEITNKDLMLPHVSSVFHGRDVFAPAAAHLAAGVPLKKFGPPITDLATLHIPSPISARDGLTGQVIHVDRFGNAVTNIDEKAFREREGRKVVIEIDRREIHQMHKAYNEASEGETFALFGSFGLLEIAINKGSAAARHGIKINDQVKVRWI